MKSAREHEVIVGRQLLQSGLEFALVDQAPGLVDDNERVNDPIIRIPLDAAAHPVKAWKCTRDTNIATEADRLLHPMLLFRADCLAAVAGVPNRIAEGYYHAQGLVQQSSKHARR